MDKAIDRVSARLLKHPELLNRIDRLLDIIENEDGQISLADDAEERVVGEMRQFGRELLGEWAKEECQRQEGKVLNSSVCVRKKSKKKSTGTQRMEPST